MGIATVIAGDVIPATWGNFVADRIVGRFANAAERDAAITVPSNGMIIWRTDLGAPELRKGGAWVPLMRDTTRVGCSLTTTGQAVLTGAATDLGWTTEIYDTDNFHAGTATTVTIPAGLGGVYSFSAYIDSGGTLNGASVIAVVSGASINRMAYVPSGNRYLAVSTVFEMTAGASATVRMTNGHSGTVTVGGQFIVARISV
jgi:hypothetical protein